MVVRDNFDATGMKVGGIQATLDGKNIQAVVSDSSLAGKMVGNTAVAWKKYKISVRKEPP